jgi:acid phosphatase type 7
MRFIAAAQCIAIVLAVSALASSAMSQTPPSAGSATVFPPYLQNPTADGMTICFLAQAAEDVRVVWNRKSAEATIEAAAKGLPIPGTPWTIWKARLTALRSGGDYRYQVRYRLAGKDEATPTYHFRTLNPHAKTVRFAAFHDIHNRQPTLAALMRSVKPDDYEFSLLLGDCWTNPAADRGSREVFRAWGAYLRLLDAANKPVIFVRGNHETIGSFADKLAYLFDLPELDPSAKFAEQNWHFTLRAGPIWFLALDGGDDFTKRYELFQPIRKRQADWMRKRLADRAGDDAPWRLLLTHMPLYNDNIWNSEPCRQMWEPVLKDAGIDLELSGHEHHWKLLDRNQTFTVHFNGHYPDQQDPQNRSEYSFTSHWPLLIGGGPSARKDPEEATVMLVTAEAASLQVRLLAASDGRLLTGFKTAKPQGRKP